MFLRHTSGFVHGQAARSRGLPGVLRLHIREEHPQRFPYCGSGLHEQTAACGQTQPRAPPLQETPTPSQQDRAALLHIQQGQVQELLHYVNTAEIQKKKKARTWHELQPLQWVLLFAASIQTLSHSLTLNSNREPNVQRMKNCLMLIFNDTCTKKQAL